MKVIVSEVMPQGYNKITNKPLALLISCGFSAARIRMYVNKRFKLGKK
ncbi:MAG: hypothetical protein WC797_02815 [Candidatus Paceibacterota bacterium]|jgi:hypothetical protein